jgi:hypothetical protein
LRRFFGSSMSEGITPLLIFEKSEKRRNGRNGRNAILVK